MKIIHLKYDTCYLIFNMKITFLFIKKCKKGSKLQIYNAFKSYILSFDNSIDNNISDYNNF
jgi:hypothetical protein